MRPLPFLAALLAGSLVARAALADRVLVLPSKEIGADLGAAAEALGHEAVAEEDARTALGKVADGVADTAEEYRVLAEASGAAWVVSGAEVGPGRVEVTAYSAEAARVESVARRIERPKVEAQVREMLAVLLRPEGVGTGALPWEREPAPAPGGGAQGTTVRLGREGEPAALPPPGPVLPYGVPLPWLVGGNLGAAFAALRPEGASGSAASLAGHLRFGRSIGGTELELLAQLGGNLLGPRVGWLEAGGRFAFARLPFFGMAGYGAAMSLALRAHGGAALRFGVEASGQEGISTEPALSPTLGGGLDVILRARAPEKGGSFQLELGLGEPRLFFFEGGTVLSLGASLGAGYRF